VQQAWQLKLDLDARRVRFYASHIPTVVRCNRHVGSGTENSQDIAELVPEFVAGISAWQALEVDQNIKGLPFCRHRRRLRSARVVTRWE
jgi:hypothetical protein